MLTRDSARTDDRNDVYCSPTRSDYPFSLFGFAAKPTEITLVAHKPRYAGHPKAFPDYRRSAWRVYSHSVPLFLKPWGIFRVLNALERYKRPLFEKNWEFRGKKFQRTIPDNGIWGNQRINDLSVTYTYIFDEWKPSNGILINSICISSFN